MEDIKFIYFDVGGVVVKDFSKTLKWEDFMSALNVKENDYERFDEYWEGLNVSVRDDMSSIVPLINKEFGLDLPKNHDLLVEFVNRFEKNKSIWPAIIKAKNKYKIGLLTNMYPRMLSSLERNGLMPDIQWDVVIDSSIEHLQKPDKEFFDVAQMRAGFPPENIFFVENSKGHIEAAKKLGWKTFYYDSSEYEQSSYQLLKML